MRADLMAAGDQFGWADLIRAATPATWGHAIEVPDWKFQLTERLSKDDEEGGVSGGHAAKMFTPGALMSGCCIDHIQSNLKMENKSENKVMFL